MKTDTRTDIPAASGMPPLGKRGQMYIFAAIMLITLSFVLIQTASTVEEPRETFRDVRENFAYEIPKVVNSGVYAGDNVSYRLERFIDLFDDFVRTRNQDFQILYLYASPDTSGLGAGTRITVRNRLALPAGISYGTTVFSLDPSNEQIINTDEDVTVSVGNNSYTFSFLENDHDFKALFRSERVR
ncbi:hypothetical protein JXB02_04975 [Candidatus Woesearchaeota archaeon]|nr:hypothetical protein [Candidatus Woesearchaeota archaeon]